MKICRSNVTLWILASKLLDNALCKWTLLYLTILGLFENNLGQYQKSATESFLSKDFAACISIFLIQNWLLKGLNKIMDKSLPQAAR